MGHLEAAAEGLAVAVRDAGQRKDERTWCALHRARVQLLLALATDAIDTWEPDEAYLLLQAAWQAIGNVDEGWAPSLDAFEGPHEIALCRAVRAETARLFVMARTEDTYDEMMTYSSVELVQALVRRMDRRLDVGEACTR